MRAWIVPPGSTSNADLRRVDRRDPQPGYGQVLVRVRAVSLNYRDRMVVNGTYFSGPNTRDLVPLSDGAGEVAAIGARRLSTACRGSRGRAVFPAAPGRRARRAARSRSARRSTARSPTTSCSTRMVSSLIPADLSDEEAACLPCAAVTAWHALFRAGRPIHAGDTVLVLGTGGVSIFALQFARSTGARVIATSSTDEKLERLMALGASDAINYTAHARVGQGGPASHRRSRGRLRRRGRGRRDVRAVPAGARARRQGMSDWLRRRTRRGYQSVSVDV